MKVLILGSTGSIGRNVLDVISNNRENFEVVGLASKSNIELLEKQAKEFNVSNICIVDKKKLKDRSFKRIFSGEEGLLELISKTKPDILVNAIVGIGGLKPTFFSVVNGVKRIALANKESVVVAGNILMQKIKKKRVKLLPIDSEHSAILQCIDSEKDQYIKKIILTASGGPLFKRDIKDKTPEVIVSHPVWKMGKKISVDSATLVNKGFEYIETHFLYSIPYEKIDILIHPQSIIHSLVEFFDGNIKAVLFSPDMRIPISYTLGVFVDKRIKNSAGNLSIEQLNKMEFYKVDYDKFPLLKLLLDIAKTKSQSYLVVFNAANEILVEKFLGKEISFDFIYKLLKKIIEKHNPVKIKSLDDILYLDKITREQITKDLLNRKAGN